MPAVESILNHAEDHFCHTGEWYMLVMVMRVKILLRIPLFRRGWL